MESHSFISNTSHVLHLRENMSECHNGVEIVVEFCKHMYSKMFFQRASEDLANDNLLHALTILERNCERWELEESMSVGIAKRHC